jgi:hypothetical protein
MLGNVLDITSTLGRLDVSTVRPIMSEPYTPANLRIERSAPAHIDVQSKNITCDIDSSACQAEEGHKTATRLTEDHAADCMVSVEEYAKSASQLGQWFVHAQKGENVYKEAAKSELTGEIPDTGIKFIPSVRPTITWNMNSLHITGVPEQDYYNWSTASMASVSVERKGSVTISEPVKPAIDIEVHGDFNTLNLFQSVDRRA